MTKRREPTLEDVLAEPDDLDLRMVWADALQQRGDPRGELAALQLAGTPTYEAWMRERALVLAHGEEWAAPLDGYFHDPVFEGGVFAGRRPRYSIDPDPDDLEGTPGASFAEPAWRAVTTIVGLDHGARILDQRDVPIRRLREVWEMVLVELLEGHAKQPLKRVIEIGIKPQGDGSPRTKALASCKALPGLKVLTIDSPRPHIAKLLTGAPVLQRIERLGIEGVDTYTREATDKLVEAAEASRGALREVVIGFGKYGKNVGWRITLRREAPGPFTQIVAWWRKEDTARPPKDLALDCVRILNLVPRNKVRSLSIEVGKPMRFPSDTLRTLAEQLAEMSLEHCVVPWQATPLKQAAAGERRWSLELGRCDALPKLSDAWRVFGPELGIAWDAMSADSRGTPALGKDPVAALKKRAKGKLRDGLSLVRTGSADAIELRVHSWVRGSFTSARAPNELAAWFASAVATLEPASVASCGLADNVDDIEAFDLETYGSAGTGWIIALPPPVARGLTAKHLTKLGAVPVEGPDRTRVVFTIGDDPSKIDDRRARAFAASLVAVLDELRATKAPKWFAPLVRKQVAPIAKRLKLAKTADHPMRLEWSRGKSFIRVRLDDTEGAWQMKVQTQSFNGGGTKIRKPADAEGEIASSIGRFD